MGDRSYCGKVIQHENTRRREKKRLVYCWIRLLHSLTTDTLQRSKLKPSERLVHRGLNRLALF